jgi:hypothetical protein
MSKIKKLLPLILLLAGVLVFVGVLLLAKGKKGEGEDEVALMEVALAERPIASLTPSDDGHWLTLTIEKIEIDAESLDYELLYKLPDGRTQGVPGTVALKGESQIERELLLGSESSGKFRYDEGVKNGTLTLRFRNKKGKLLAKFSTEFSLLSGTNELPTVDGAFTANLSKKSDDFFVVMETFGVAEMPQADVVAGPYGVFSSAAAASGTIDISSGTAYQWTGKAWNKVSGQTSVLGVFAGLSE